MLNDGMVFECGSDRMEINYLLKIPCISQGSHHQTGYVHIVARLGTTERLVAILYKISMQKEMASEGTRSNILENG